MSLLAWFGLKSPAPPSPQNNWSLTNTEFFASPTSSGKSVTERSAMQMTAVYACVRILAEAVASLPLHLYQQREGSTGGNELATTHPLYRVLHDEPNAEMISFVFRETLMTHLLLGGLLAEVFFCAG